MDVLRRFSRISRKERIRNGNYKTTNWTRGNNYKRNWTEPAYMVRPCSENGRRKIIPKITLKWMQKQKRARGRPNKNWMEGIRKAMNERNLNEGQWEDRKQWSLGVGQRRKKFWNQYICVYIYIYIYIHLSVKVEIFTSSIVSQASVRISQRTTVCFYHKYNHINL